jgi:hypothetical protein
MKIYKNASELAEAAGGNPTTLMLFSTNASPSAERCQFS